MTLFEDSHYLSDQAKLLVILDFLSRDRIITMNAQSLLKPLIFDNDPAIMSLLPLLEATDSDSKNKFIDELYQVIDSRTEDVFDGLFENTGIEVAKHASKSERAEKDLTKDRSLIYGEVEFGSFSQVLRKVCTNMPPGGVFFDIGSGSGRGVMVARMTQDFDACVGVELMDGLADLAENIGEKYEEGVKKDLHTGLENRVEFYKADFLEFDWRSGSVVFANSTCFTDSLMAEIARKARGMGKGSFLITFTKGIKCEDGIFELVEKKRYNMSWGPATVFVHVRTALQEGEEGGEWKEESSEEESEEEEDEVDSDEMDSDIDSGFYSSSAGGRDATPTASVASSVDYGSPKGGMRVETTREIPIAPLSPGMSRVAADQIGGMSSPKDTMLMNRKRMRSKGMADAARKRELEGDF